MVFSETTNKTGIIQQIEFRTGLGDTTISSNTTLLKLVTNLINNWYLRATKLIITADGKWQWDDINQTDDSCATTSLVDSQQDYRLLSASPDTNQDWLDVERLEIKDNAGNWITLAKLNARDFGSSIEETFETDNTPQYYDFDGTSIKLFPAPNYASTNGMKAWMSRTPLLFAYDATSKRPGFASIFHEYLVLGPQYDIVKDITKNNDTEKIMRDIVKMEQEMKDYYGKRDQTDPMILQRSYQNFK